MSDPSDLPDGATLDEQLPPGATLDDLPDGATLDAAPADTTRPSPLQPEPQGETLVLSGDGEWYPKRNWGPWDATPEHRADVRDEQEARLSAAFDVARRNAGKADSLQAVALAEQFQVSPSLVQAAMPAWKEASERAGFDARRFLQDSPVLAGMLLEHPELGTLVQRPQEAGNLMRVWAKLERLWKGYTIETAAAEDTVAGKPPSEGAKDEALAKADQAEAAAVAPSMAEQLELPRDVALRQDVEAGSIPAMATLLYLRAQEQAKALEIDRKRFWLMGDELRNAINKPGDTWYVDDDAVAARQAEVLQATLDSRPHAFGDDSGVMHDISKGLQGVMSSAQGLEAALEGGSAGAAFGAVVGAVSGELSPVPGGGVEGAVAGARLFGGAAFTAAQAANTFQFETGNTYGDLRKMKTADGRPIDVQTAAGAAIVAGAAKAGLESIAFAKWTKVMGEGFSGTLKAMVARDPKFRELLGHVAVEWAESIATESFTEGLQEGVDQVMKTAAGVRVGSSPASEATPSGWPSDWRDLALEGNMHFSLPGVLDSAEAGGLGAILMGPFSHGLPAAGQFLTRVEKGRQEVTQQQVPHLFELAAQPEVQAAPLKFAAAVAGANAKDGAPLGSVHVDPHAIMAFFQKKGADEGEVAQVLQDTLGPTGKDDVTAALAKVEGGRVEVPMGVFLKTFANSELGQAVKADVAVSPTAPTQRQAKAAGAALEAEAKAIAKEYEDKRADGEAFRNRIEDFKRQAEAAGRTPREAQAGAMLLKHFIERAAAEKGQSPEAMARSVSPLTVQPESEDALRHPDPDVDEPPPPPAGAAAALLEHATAIGEEGRAAETHVDPVTGLRTPAGVQAKQWGIISTRDLKAINDHVEGGHDSANQLLAKMATALGDEAVRFGPNFGIPNATPEALEAARAAVQAVMPEGMEVQATMGQEGQRFTDANKARSDADEAARQAKTLEPRGFTRFDTGAISEAFAHEQRPHVKVTPEQLAAAKAVTPEQHAKATYFDPTVKGVLSRLGFEHTPKKAHVIAFDLKGLGNLNEQMGRNTEGDIVLKRFGQLAIRRGGEEFFFAHLSGDEFAAKGDDLEKLKGFVESLRKGLPGVGFEGTSEKTGELIVHRADFRHGIGEQTYGAADQALNRVRAEEKAAAEEKANGGATPSTEQRRDGQLAGRAGEDGQQSHHQVEPHAVSDASAPGSTTGRTGPEAAAAQPERRGTEEGERGPGALAPEAQATLDERLSRGSERPEERAALEAGFNTAEKVKKARAAVPEMRPIPRAGESKSAAKKRLRERQEAARDFLDWVENKGERVVPPTEIRAWAQKFDIVDPQSGLSLLQEKALPTIDKEARRSGKANNPTTAAERALKRDRHEAFVAHVLGRLMQEKTPEAPRWYHQAEKVALAAKQEKNSPAAWWAMLSKAPGIKAEELDLLGLKEWLDGQKASLTKQQVAEYIRQHQVVVETKDLVEDAATHPVALQEAIAKVWEEIDAAKAKLYTSVDSALATPANRLLDALYPLNNNLADLAYAAERGNDTSLSWENIHEPLAEARAAARELERPDLLAGVEAAIQAVATKESEVQAAYGRRARFGGLYASKGQRTGYRETKFTTPGHADEYNEPHFGTGVVAHIRSDVRTLAGGKAAFFAEEFQAQVHRDAQKAGGYERRVEDKGTKARTDFMEALQANGTPPRGSANIAKLVEDYAVSTDAPTEQGLISWFGEKSGRQEVLFDDMFESVAKQAVPYMQALAEEDRRTGRRGEHERPPSAPFKSNWETLLARWTIHEAASQGLTAVAWTTGNTQVGRYNEKTRQGMEAAYDQRLPSIFAKLVEKDGGKVGKSTLADTGEEVWTVTLPDTLRQRVLSEGQRLFQENPDTTDAKGYIYAPEVRGAARALRIFLTPQADFSTLVHELGHAFLEMHREMMDASPAAATVELNTALMKWLGVDSLGDIEVAHHEKFARTFEAYLREGHAPSSALAKLFSRAKEWLMGIYATLRGVPGAALVDAEARAVFDAMLATRQAREAYQAAQGPGLFSSAQEAGVTPEEWAQRVQDLRDAASEGSRKAEVAAVKQALRYREKWYREAVAKAKKSLQGDEKTGAGNEYDALPAARARAYLNEFPAQPLNRAAVTAILGANVPKWMALTEDGLDPSVAAVHLGYPDARGMLEAVAALPDANVWEQQEAEAMVAAAHPGVLDDARLMRKALATGLHEYTQKRLLAEWADLRVKDPKLGASPLEALQAAARIIVSRKKMGRLDARLALTQERASAREKADAAAKGQWDKAAKAAREEALNAAIYHELLKAREVRDAIEKEGKALSKTAARARLGKAAPAYRDAADFLRASLGLGPAPAGLDASSVAKAVEEMRQDAILGNEEPEWLQPTLEAAAKGDLRQATAAEGEQLLAAFKALRAAARLRTEALVAGEWVDKEEVIGRLLADAEANKRAGPPLPSSETAPRGVLEKLGTSMAQWGSSLIKPEVALGWLGGVLQGKDPRQSAWYQAIFAPLERARQQEADLHRSVVTPILKSLQAMPAELRKVWTQPVDGAKLFPNHRIGDGLQPIAPPSFMSELVVMGLNWGNKGNRQRLMDGRNITEAQVNAALELLPPQAIDYINTVGKAFESLKPAEFDLEERQTGIRPAEVEKVRTTLKNGTIEGHYYPVMYDARVSAQGERAAAGQVAQLMDPTYARQAPAKGHLKARAAKVVAPIALDASPLPRHLAQQVHDLTFREALQSVGGLFFTPRVLAEVKNRLGLAQAAVLGQWLKDVGTAAGVPGSANVEWYLKLLRQTRANVVVSAMGFSLTNFAEDHSSLAFAAFDRELGPGNVARGLSEYMKTFNPRLLLSAQLPFEAIHQVEAKSGFMRAANTEYERELTMRIKDFTATGWGSTKLARWLQEHSFFLMEASHKTTAFPVWLGRYHQAIDAGESESSAVEAADGAVRRLFPQHNAVNAAGIARDKMSIGMMVQFYGMFSTVFNVMADNAQIAREAPERSARVRAVARSLGALAAVGLLGGYLRGKGPNRGEDEPPELWALRTMFGTMVSMVPGLSDLGALVDGWVTGGKVGIRPSTGIGTMMGTVAEQAKKFTDSDDDAQKVEAFIKGTSPILGWVPAGQLVRTGKYAFEASTGQRDVRNPLDALSGAIYGETDKRPANPISHAADALERLRGQ